MKKLSFFTKAWRCLCLAFGLFLSSCAAVKDVDENNKGSGLWSLAISVERTGNDELLARLSDLDALRLIGGEEPSGVGMSGIVLFSPSYERLSAIRSDLLTSGNFRIRLSRTEN